MYHLIQKNGWRSDEMKRPKIRVTVIGEFTEEHARRLEQTMRKIRERVLREQIAAERQAATPHKPTGDKPDSPIGLNTT